MTNYRACGNYLPPPTAWVYFSLSLLEVPHSAITFIWTWGVPSRSVCEIKGGWSSVKHNSGKIKHNVIEVDGFCLTSYTFELEVFHPEVFVKCVASQAKSIYLYHITFNYHCCVWRNCTRLLFHKHFGMEHLQFKCVASQAKSNNVYFLSTDYSTKLGVILRFCSHTPCELNSFHTTS